MRTRTVKVQARVKAFEFWPDWAKCCQEHIDYMLGLPLMTLDVEKMVKERDVVCEFCRTEHPESVAALDIAEGDYMPLELADLDEGPEEKPEPFPSDDEQPEVEAEEVFGQITDTGLEMEHSRFGY